MYPNSFEHPCERNINATLFVCSNNHGIANHNNISKCRGNPMYKIKSAHRQTYKLKSY